MLKMWDDVHRCAATQGRASNYATSCKTSFKTFNADQTQLIVISVYTLTSLIRTPQNRAFLSTGHHLLVNFLLTSSKTHVANLLTHHIAAKGR